MAAETRTVHKTTGQHSTVQDAIDYFVDTWGGGGIATVEILDKAEYSEKVTIDNIAGTRSSTSYLELISDAAAWGAGVSPWPGGTYDSSICHGITWATAGQHVVNVNEDYTHLRHLAVYQNSTNNSDEGITYRGGGILGALVEKCVVQVNSQDQQDPIYFYANSSADRHIEVFDCVLLGEGTGSRSGFNCQQTGTAGTSTIYVVNCTINNSGSTVTSGGSACVLIQKAVSGATVNMHCYNNILFNNGNSHTVFDNNFGSTWAGQGNVGETTYIDTYMGATGNQDSVANSEFDDLAASDVRFTDMTSSTDANYQILTGTGDSNNYADGFCYDIYSSLDSRLTLGEDIAGNTRATTKTARWSGAYELAAAATDYSGDLSADSYAYTAQSLTLLTEYTATLSAASYSYTALDLAQAVDYQGDLTADSYAYTGNAFTRVNAYVGDLTADSYAYTGQALTRVNDWAGALTADAYVYTANTLNHSIGFIGALTADAYAYTANALTQLSEYLGALTADAYAYTANALDWDAGGTPYSGDLTTATYAYTEQALSRLNAYVGDLSTATYAYTAQAFTISGEAVRTLLSSLTKTLTRPLTRSNVVQDEDE